MLQLPKLQRLQDRQRIDDYGPEKHLTVTFEGSPGDLQLFLTYEGVYCNVPVPDDEEFVYRLSVEDAPVSKVLDSVAAQVPSTGQVVVRRGPNTYHIGSPSLSDLVADVFYVPSGAATEYTAAVELLGTEHAQARVVGDALVVADTPDGMERIRRMFDMLGSARGQWIAEVRYVEVTRNASAQLGIDWSLSGATVLQASAGNLLSVADGLSLVLEAAITARSTYTGVRLLESTQLLCIEGQTARLQIGQTTPVARRVVSSEGTVSTVGFDEVDTGTLARIDVRTEPDGRLRVIIDYELSSVTGFIEDNPIRTRRRVESSAVLAPGGTLVLGGFTSSRDSDTTSGVHQLAHLFSRDDTDESRIFMLMRIIPADEIEISGPLESPYDSNVTPQLRMQLPGLDSERWAKAVQAASDDGRPGDLGYIRWLYDGTIPPEK
ncbi:MAG: hypothetical protein AAGH99_00275 [Planctomycetota bacterium]